MRHWLDECLQEHQNCRFSSASLPTRVVKIEGPEKVNLYVTRGEPEQYACLSHCWEHRSVLVTTHASLEQYTSGIDRDKIPKTFQDAISFTHRLGLRYLWIDSLCVVQDSLSNWRHEGTKMANISQGVRITLAAMTSKDASGGSFATAHSSHVSEGLQYKIPLGNPIPCILVSLSRIREIRCIRKHEAGRFKSAYCRNVMRYSRKRRSGGSVIKALHVNALAYGQTFYTTAA